MKKFIVFVLLIALIIFIGCRDNEYNPYSGKYEFKTDIGLELVLNKDYSFTMIKTSGKSSFSERGKYQVEDNNITLTPDKGNLDKFVTEPLHGKIEGSRIRITEFNGDFIKY